MTMRALCIAGLVAAGLMVAPAAEAQNRTIINLQGETEVATEGDLALLSLWERPRRARLSILRDGVITPLPMEPFNLGSADIGTDAAGNPLVVYTVCSGKKSCKVMRLALNPDGTAAGEPTPVPGLPATAKTPTVSRGMLAYSSRTRIYTRPLDAPGKVRRQPAAPKRNCDVVSTKTRDRCRVRDVYIGALELHGTQLAVRLGYYVKNQDGGGVMETRLVDTRRRKVQTIDSSPINEGGVSWFGDPAFDTTGRLVFSEICFDGCDPGVLYRYQAQTRTLERVKLRRFVLDYAVLGDTALVVISAGSFDYDCPTLDGRQCRLAQTRPLKWKRVKT